MATVYKSIFTGPEIDAKLSERVPSTPSGSPLHDLFVAGGGAQSDEICQITANMFGLPVHRIQTFEASGLGSSTSAAKRGRDRRPD